MDSDRVSAVVKNKYWVEVDWASGGTQRIPLPVFKLLPLREGTEADRREYGRRALEAEYSCALETAGRILARWDRSEAQMDRALRQRGYQAQTVQRVLDFLRQRRYTDDERLSALEAQRLGKRTGIRQIGQKLRARGIDPETVEAALAGVSDGEQLMGATALAARALRRSSEKEEKEVDRRALAMLIRKGYAYEIAREALRRAREEAD